MVKVMYNDTLVYKVVIGVFVMLWNKKVVYSGWYMSGDSYFWCTHITHLFRHM